MLVDFDYFFAQCEELRNPSLRDKPVVIGVYSGRTEDSGAVSTANYLARQYGVKSGIPLFLAKKKLANVDSVFLPVDYEYYEEISDRIMQVLSSHADVFEQVGVDEAYLDVTRKTQGSFENAGELATTLKQLVKNQVGATFSVGIGPNKLLAKIACDVNKPDGLTTVKPKEVESFLKSLPVDRLIGVGRKISQKMNDLAITTIGDLSGYDVQRLVMIFGKTLGVYFHNASNGVDNEPVKETGEAESISRIATLKQNTRDLALISEKAEILIGDIHKELLQNDLNYRQVGVITVMSDLTIRNRSLTLEQPTNSVETLRDVVRLLFDKLLNEETSEARRIGVKVSQLSKNDKNQRQLTSFLQN
jgi:DNA polymerase IV (archaeal DinB-like DNA polymerase)